MSLPRTASRLSRRAAVPVLGLVLVAGTACTSSDDEAGSTAGNAAAATESAAPAPTGADPLPKVEPSVKPKSTAKPPAPGAKPGGVQPGVPATNAQLAAALLGKSELPAADYQVDGADRLMGGPPAAGLAADRVECAVFAQESIHNAGAAEAWAHREYAGKGAAQGARMGITLSGHRGEAGAKLLADVDRALAGCAVPFTVDPVAAGAAASKPEKWSVAPVDNAPLLGDETVAYRVAVQAADGNRTFTVVLIRFGATVAHFAYGGDGSPNHPPYAAFMAAQVQKAKPLLGS
ncbi:hypothetical protein [Yinghuangia soli]|nr:hypothetical protein [Yinghuangia soli]